MWNLIYQSNLSVLILILSLSAILLTACGGKTSSNNQPVALEKKLSIDNNQQHNNLESKARKEPQYSAQLNPNSNKSQKSKEQESIQLTKRDLSNPDYLVCKNSSQPSACISFQRKFQRDLENDNLEQKKNLAQRKKYLNQLNQEDSATKLDEQRQSSPRLVKQQPTTTALGEQRRAAVGVDTQQPSLTGLGQQRQFLGEVDKQLPSATGLDQRCRSFTGLDQRCRSIPNLGEQRPSVNGLDGLRGSSSAVDKLSPSELRRGVQSPAKRCTRSICIDDE